MSSQKASLIRLASSLPQGSEERRSILALTRRVGMEFDTKEALEAYLKEHPGADKSLHSVKKPKDEKGEESDSHSSWNDEEEGEEEERFEKSIKRIIELETTEKTFISQNPKIPRPSKGGKLSGIKTVRDSPDESDKAAYKEAYEEWSKKITEEVTQRNRKIFEEGRKARKGKNWRGEAYRPTYETQSKLKEKLSQLGGKMDDPWDQVSTDPDLAKIIKSGEKYPGKGKVQKEMADGECHWNVSKLFEAGEVDSIVIGYARNDAGWHQHTWGLKDGKVVETTAGNFNAQDYYGLPLEGKAATAFASWAKANPPGGGVVRRIPPPKGR